MTCASLYLLPAIRGEVQGRRPVFGCCGGVSLAQAVYWTPSDAKASLAEGDGHEDRARDALPLHHARW